MIRILGVRRELLPNRSALQAMLKRQWLFAWLDRHRSMRVDRLACNSLAGLFLLMHAGAEGELIYDDNGRPFFKDSAIDFNITHSDNMIFCVVSFPEGGEGEIRVGLDAETPARFSAIRLCPLAKRWFTENEQALFFESPIASQFLQIWTKKESLAKMIGEGLRCMPYTDTTTAGERYGIDFADYRVENAIVTLCHPKKVRAPGEIEMLRLEQIEPYLAAVGRGGRCRRQKSFDQI